MLRYCISIQIFVRPFFDSVRVCAIRTRRTMATTAALPTLVLDLLRGVFPSNMVPLVPFVLMYKIILMVLRLVSFVVLLVTTLNITHHGVALAGPAGSEAPLRPPERDQNVKQERAFRSRLCTPLTSQYRWDGISSTATVGTSTRTTFGTTAGRSTTRSPGGRPGTSAPWRSCGRRATGSTSRCVTGTRTRSGRATSFCSTRGCGGTGRRPGAAPDANRGGGRTTTAHGQGGRRLSTRHAAVLAPDGKTRRGTGREQGGAAAQRRREHELCARCVFGRGAVYPGGGRATCSTWATWTQGGPPRSS